MTDVQTPVEIAVSRLQVHTRSETGLYHRSGRLVVPAGQCLTPEVLLSLVDAGIEQVYTSPERADRPPELEPFDVGSIVENAPLPHAVYDQDGMLLAHAGESLATRQVDALHHRGGPTVYRERPDGGGQCAFFQARYVVRVRDRLDDQIAFGKCSLRAERSGIPLARTSRVYAGRVRASAILWHYEHFYKRACAEIESMWQRLAAGGYIRNSELARFVNEIVDRFQAERELLMALASAHTSLPADGEHALGTAVYCLAAALRLGLNRAQARELVVAALFHDAGFIYIPRALLGAPRSLTRSERQTVFRHIEHALFLAGRLDWPGEDWLIAIYQHHERGTGAGYPSGYRADRIADCAGILAAADVYHALVTNRPHRRAFLPADALNRLMKMATIGLLDRATVKALAEELSLYPVGSTVLLSTGESARVVASTADPARPWVATLADADAVAVDAHRVLDLSRYPGISIRSELQPTLEPLLGF